MASGPSKPLFPILTNPEPPMFSEPQSRIQSRYRRRTRCLVVLCLLMMGMQLSAQNADLPYTSPSTGADGALVIPAVLPALGDFDAPIDAVYNEQSGTVFVIGRDRPRRLNSNDGTVTYEFVDGSWVYHGRESEKFEYALTYDKARGQVVRVGYFSERINIYAGGISVWTGSEWDTVDGLPYSLGSPGLAFDEAREQVLLFGGKDNDENELDYTLLWDGVSWTEVTPEVSPDPRMRPAMVYDPLREEVLLFGGDDGYYTGSFAEFDDTWTWDGSSWTQKTPANTPPAGYPAMEWDPNREAVLLVVTNADTELETWEWNGSDWNQLNPANVPPVRKYFDIVYDPSRNGILLFNGKYEDAGIIADTWLWDGADWTVISESPYVFDMNEKPDGVWNYTRIEIGTTQVRFIRNAANTPVIWHASEGVRIDGDLVLNGEDAVEDTLEEFPYTRAAKGGPGGYDGGLGGFFVNADGADHAGFPGEGPGGGLPSMPGDEATAFDGRHAEHFGRYDSPDLQTFHGGSGGGGSATSTYAIDSEWGRGANGGGGGGAIMITSSRDIFLNGQISAEGGRGGEEFYQRSGLSGPSRVDNYGGSGSGGAIRLVADRVLRSLGGRTNVTADRTFRHDYPILAENEGIVTIEAYFENITSFELSTPNYTHFQPRLTLAGSELPGLAVESVAGQSVSADPSGDPASPEITFSSAADIEVVVSADNLPDGRRISLRVAVGSEVIEPDPVALSGGSATFSITVPAGSGRIWAWTTWEDQP